MRWNKYPKNPKKGLYLGEGDWEKNQQLHKLRKLLKDWTKAQFMQAAPNSDGYVFPYVPSLPEYEDEYLDTFVDVAISVILDELEEQGELAKEIVQKAKS